MRIRKDLRDNGLAIVMFGIFALSLIGMSIAGWRSDNEALTEHNQPTESYISYLGSGDFIEGVFENWESEFLQMWSLVVLTIFLKQKGAVDSKPMRGKSPEDTHSRYSLIHSLSRHETGRAARHLVYSHSLSLALLALLALFVMSFILHAIGGAAAYSQEAAQHGGQALGTLGFLMTSDFWYQSLQNWQSEFLAVGTLMILSIKLRERGSPESKPVGRKYDHKTGS